MEEVEQQGKTEKTESSEDVLPETSRPRRLAAVNEMLLS
jgi:hypothetical protein